MEATNETSSITLCAVRSQSSHVHPGNPAPRSRAGAVGPAINYQPSTLSFSLGHRLQLPGATRQRRLGCHRPYDFQFTVYDAASGGAQDGAGPTTNAVAVSNGLFTVTLDFGSVFDGNARWLELGVRSNGVAAGLHHAQSASGIDPDTVCSLRAECGHGGGGGDSRQRRLSGRGEHHRHRGAGPVAGGRC